LTVTLSGYAEATDVVCTVIAVVNSGESQQESAAITTGTASELIPFVNLLLLAAQRNYIKVKVIVAYY